MPKDDKDRNKGKDLEFRRKIAEAFGGGRRRLSERMKKRERASEKLVGRGRRR